MPEDQKSDFYREYDLIKARKFPSNKKPEPHQSKALDKLSKWYKNDSGKPAGGILVLPTGGGKTFTAVRFLCQHPISEGYKIIWLAHTHHLLEQAFYTFGYEVSNIIEPKDNLNVRIVSGAIGHFKISSIKPTDEVLICTLQTIIKAYQINHPCLKEFLNSAKGKLFIVFDEAHHSPAPSYRKLIESLRKQFPDMHLLGLTATPTHSDEKKKGWFKILFPQGIIEQANAQKLMAQGILAKPIIEEPITKFTPNFDEREYRKWVNTYQDLPEDIITQLANNRDRNEFIAETYAKQKAKYKKTIIFADRWHQCNQICEFLRKRKVNADVMYSHIDANLGSAELRNKRDKDENAKVLDKFKHNQLDVVINVKMLTEGIDVPDANSVFLTRQTTSETLLKQMIGRALRGPKFGGTETANIVAFIDNWKQTINWAEYDQLAEGIADSSIPEYGKRPPLHLISIDLVRKLSQQMDTGLNINTKPFLTFIPLGWYRVEYDALVEGSEDQEPVRNLIMVFENQKNSYDRFIEILKERDLVRYGNEDLKFHDCENQIKEWCKKYFPEEPLTDNLLTNIFQILRHMAQNDKEFPKFFEFEERRNHNLDNTAELFIKDNIGLAEIDESLETEYKRPEKYWQTIYPRYDYFKSQFDACVNRIRQVKRYGSEYDPDSIITRPELIPDREPSEEIKMQVKKRDGYKCLCCTENNRRLLVIDHKSPSYLGGINSIDNLQTLCRNCNSDKGIKDINFTSHSSILPQAQAILKEFNLPSIKKELDIPECLRFLYRSINFYYRCSAVVEIIKGKTDDVWKVGLYDGIDTQWLKPHLQNLVKRIRFALKENGYKPLNGIEITSPNQKTVRFRV